MKKILVIEDEADIRESLIDILELADYECQEATNGIEGVKMAKNHLPDLIVCDVMMPELDGYGVLLELQDDPKTALIPFVFLTAKATKEDVRKGMALGADDYVIKPFTADELLTAVTKRLEKYNMLYGASAKKAEDLRLYLNMTLPHELRTPLTGLIGYMELLTTGYDDFDPSMIQMMLRRMYASANRLHRLVENYLLHAQLLLTQQDEVLLTKLRDYSQCDNPHEYIEQIAYQKATEHKRPADLQVQQIARANLAIHPDNLQKIVAELIDNAFKFSQEGTPVVVEAQVDGNCYRLKISDQGRGMTPEQANSISVNQQFNREKYEQQGAGLGLVLSKQLATVFGGDMLIDSTLNQGTTVCVDLPMLAT